MERDSLLRLEFSRDGIIEGLFVGTNMFWPSVHFDSPYAGAIGAVVSFVVYEGVRVLDNYIRIRGTPPADSSAPPEPRRSYPI
ncbi:MAG: hypothetical protein HYW25_00300 [Candidatus Aenigmarchaeota archaeon]|nr:hypothetical protein [Candidatus Aenigmarchaeota archaeon]